MGLSPVDASQPRRNTICLSMIVRDEAAVIQRCLQSVKPYIDAWVIADTGSKDETIAIVERELAGIPGIVRRDEWRDFSTNRNLALEEARRFGCEYLLTLDADEELVMPEGAEFRGLTADAYSPAFCFANADQDCVWRRPMLMRSEQPWRYIGVVHERLELHGATVDTLGDVKVVSHHDGARNQDEIQKYWRDAKLLKKALKSEPHNTRYWFYLGMTLSGAQRIDDAIRAFRKRASMGPGCTPEEVFYSLYQVAALREFRKDDWRDVVNAYLIAYNERPTRAEPIWKAAQLFGDNREFATAELFARKAASMPYPRDALMVHQSVYAWRAANDLAGYLAEQGKLDEAKAVLTKLFGLQQLPEEQRPFVAENIRRIEAAAA